VPVFLVSVLTTVIVIEYFVVKYPPLTAAKDELLLWGAIIYSFVMLFGYTMLILHHLRQMRERGRGRLAYLSGIKLGTLGAFVLLGLLSPGGADGSQYRTLYSYIVGYAAAGMYTAWVHHPYNVYRFFRPTSVQSTIMFLTWLFLVFRELSVIVAVYPPLYDIGTWIESVPNAAAQRAALAAAGVGTLILGVRAIVGKEPGLIEMEVS
jgi:hypothetical protein